MVMVRLVDVGAGELGVAAAVIFMTSLSFWGKRSKLAPLMVTWLPCAAIRGVNESIRGFADDDVTVNEFVVVTVPAGDVAIIGPVVAPEGTVTTRLVADAETIVAVVPLNLTVSCEGVALKFEPEIVTCVPTGPDVGVNVNIAGWLEPILVIERIFPTTSYVYFAASPVPATAPTNLPSWS